jgi:hypothetical protein
MESSSLPDSPYVVPASSILPPLPSEVLLMILQQLPGSFFQEDIRRLTVSKRWYSLAVSILYSRIVFTPRVCTHFVRLEGPVLDKALANLRRFLRCLNIVINGERETSANNLGGETSGRDPNNASNSLPPSQRNKLPVYSTTDRNWWKTEQSIGVAVHKLIVDDLPDLTAVRFTANWSNRSWHADPVQPDYLLLYTLPPFNLMAHIKSLDLDLHGSNIRDWHDRDNPLHFCSHIRSLLSRFQTLRLRTRCLCVVAFSPPEDSNGKPLPVTVSHLTINVFLSRASEYNPKLNVTRQCYTWPRSRKLDLDVIRKAMQKLVKKMPSPRRAELVHMAPNGEIHVWDAIKDDCERDLSEPLVKIPSWCASDYLNPCFYSYQESDLVEWSGEVH